MKTLIVSALGNGFLYLWKKIENFRALAMKRRIQHGKEFFLINPGFLELHSDFVVGDRVYINSNLTAMVHVPIKIGDDVMIGPNVSLFSVGHDPDLSGAESRASRIHGSILIETGVWIGGGSILLPGVTIGRNSVIGAGSLVTKSIPPDVIAGGNPCRVIRDKKSTSL